MTLPSSPVRQLSLTGASTGSADPLVNEVAHDNGVSREKSIEGVELKKRIEQCKSKIVSSLSRALRQELASRRRQRCLAAAQKSPCLRAAPMPWKNWRNNYPAACPFQ